MIYKRGEIYWTKFQHARRMIYKSTGQTSQTKARQVEAKLRSELAMGNFGILSKKAVPTLAEFCEKRFAPWVQSTCSLKTWRDFYRVGLLAIQGYTPLANLALDVITTERVAEFASHRQAQGMKVATVNASLRILRRVLRVAMEWGEIGKVPNVKMLPGEHHREFVLTPEEEARYLAAAPEPLASLATVLADSGMRPEECYRLQWELVAWVNGRHGTLFVTRQNQSGAAHPADDAQSQKHFRDALECRREAAGRLRMDCAH